MTTPPSIRYNTNQSILFCSLRNERKIFNGGECDQWIAKWPTKDQLESVAWLPADITLIDVIREQMWAGKFMTECGSRRRRGRYHNQSNPRCGWLRRGNAKIYDGSLWHRSGTSWDIATFTTFLACFVKLSVKSSSAAKLFNAVHKAQISWKRICPLMKPTEEKEKVVCGKPGELCRKRTEGYEGRRKNWNRWIYGAWSGTLLR